MKTVSALDSMGNGSNPPQAAGRCCEGLWARAPLHCALHFNKSPACVGELRLRVIKFASVRLIKASFKAGSAVVLQCPSEKGRG